MGYEIDPRLPEHRVGELGHLGGPGGRAVELFKGYYSDWFAALRGVHAAIGALGEIFGDGYKLLLINRLVYRFVQWRVNKWICMMKNDDEAGK